MNVNIAEPPWKNHQAQRSWIGTYILFQETYHKESYGSTPKPTQLCLPHGRTRTAPWEVGIDDVGLGVLFGLEHKYEFAGLLMHAEHLEAVHGVGPHQRAPSLKRADDIIYTFDNGIDDDTFAKIVA